MATIKILAKDIKQTEYASENHDCAITRALRRAGYKMHDVGIGIMTDKGEKWVVIDDYSETYQDMRKKVAQMYRHYGKEIPGCLGTIKGIPPKDFEVELSLEQ